MRPTISVPDLRLQSNNKNVLTNSGLSLNSIGKLCFTKNIYANIYNNYELQIDYHIIQIWILTMEIDVIG